MDPTAKDRALDVIRSLGYQNLFISVAKKAESFFKSNIIISINDRCLMSFDQKGSKVTNQFSWLTTTFILREDNKLKFQFNKNKYSFEFVEEDLFRACSNALQHILLPSELKEIGFDQFRLRPVSYTPKSAINRMVERAILQGVPLSQSTLNAIKSILYYSQPTVKLSDLPEIATFLAVFLDSLPFCTDIKNLSICNYGDIDPYKIALPYSNLLNCLKCLEIVGLKSESFPKFLNTISDQKESNLCSISFQKSGFGNDDLIMIHDFILKREIKIVEFHDAIQSDASLSFYSKFLSPELTSMISILNLDGTRKIIELSLLIPKIGKLVGLSLANCSVEVGDTLSQLSQLTNLRILDLSNNCCRKVITSLPPSITSLYLNSVNWLSQTLSQFMTHLPSHRMKLWISSIKTQDPEYQLLFDSLPNAQSAFLTDLTWDYNKLHPRFFDFLAANKRLTFLSLSQCFKESNEENANLLRQYLEQVHTVKKLIIRGDSHNFLGRTIEIVVNAILQSPQIEYLDLLYSKSSDLGLRQIRRLLSPQGHLKFLMIDGIKPSTAQGFCEFLRDAASSISSSSSQNLMVSFPHSDLNSLVKKKLLSQADFDQLQSLFMKSDTVYRQFHENDMPHFLSKNELESLTKPVEILTMPSNKSSSPLKQNGGFNTLNIIKKVSSPPGDELFQGGNKIGTKRRTSEIVDDQKNSSKSVSKKPKQLMINQDSNSAESNNKPSVNQSNKYISRQQQPQKMQQVQREKPEQKTIAPARRTKSSQRIDPTQKAGTLNSKPKPKNPEWSFGSEPASYNTESSEEFFLPKANLPKPSSVAPIHHKSQQQQRNQPIEQDQDLPIRKKKKTKKVPENDSPRDEVIRPKTKKRLPRAASEVPKSRKPKGIVEIEEKEELPKPPKNNNGNITSQTTSEQKPRNERHINAPKKKKRNFVSDQPLPNTPKEDNQSVQTTGTRKKHGAKISTAKPLKSEQQPLIRGKATKRHREEIEMSYQKPDWKFPIKMNFVLETDETNVIEESYSTKRIIREIFKKPKNKADSRR